MTKQEIVNAINATIVANGQKGITAESLNNILNEMVNATPEGGSGGGDGLLKVYLPDPMLGFMFVEKGGFNIEIWNQIKTELETQVPSNILDAYETVVNEYLAANTLVYQTLIQKAQAKEGIAVLADMSKLYSIGSLLIYDPTGELGVETNSSIGIVGNVMIDSQSISEEHYDFVQIFLAQKEIGDSYGNIILNSDGTLRFEPISNSSYTLIIPKDGATLEEKHISANAAFAYNINNFPGTTLGEANIVVRFFSNGNVGFMTSATLLTSEVDSSGFKGTYLDGTTFKQVYVGEDGTTTVTTLGTLTAA